MEETRFLLEEIKNMAAFVRDMEVGEIRIAILPKERHKSFNSSTSRENRKFKMKGIDKWVMYWSNSEQGRVAVRAMTIEESENIKNGITKTEDYEKDLPAGFFSPRLQWRKGSWYA